MFNKLYEEVKKIIKENIIFLIIYVLLILSIVIKLPYVISMPGDIESTNDKVIIETEYKEIGNYNLAFVKEMKASPLTLLISLFNKKWDVEKISENALLNENYEDIIYRDKMLLEEGNNISLMLAYNMANKKYEIVDTSVYVLTSDTLNTKDEIISIDDNSIDTIEDVKNIINSKEVGSEVTIQVKNDKLINKKVKIKENNGNKIIGAYLIEKKIIKANPNITFNVDKKESGSSGGLMMTLTIYDKLIEEDLTKGRIICGTGSVDILGNVLKIGGIKQKLLGLKNVDIFFVPIDNKEEAIDVIDEYNLNINVVFVKTVEEAIEYLKNTDID